MAQNLDFYYPFDSIKGDRVTTAATERRFFHDLYSDGVVGSGGFAIRVIDDGVFAIGEGTAMIGGAIGGLISERQIEAKPASGVTTFIVLRLETRAEARKISLDVVSSPLTDTTQAQLDEGGVLDLVLYSVTGQTGGGYGILDQRKYASSFDSAVYSRDFQALYDSAKTQTDAQIDALRVRISAAIAEANAETAGLYGAAARQGFINPNFAVNQRNGAYSLTSGKIFTFDHWSAEIEGRAASGKVYIYKNWGDDKRLALQIENQAYSGSTGAASSCISQTIENGVVDFCNAGKRFTVSFDAKADTPQRVAVEPVQFAFGNTQTIAAQVVNVSTEWQRFSLTFEGTITTASNSGGENYDWLKIPFYFAWAGNSERFGVDQNAANNIYFANMQINGGSSALPCYEPPYAEQLRQCQRYYCAFGKVSLAAGNLLQTTKQAVTSPLPLPCSMYRTPDAVTKDRSGASGVASAEVVTGGWRNGLACSMSAESDDSPVFVVTNTDGSELTRVVFNSITLNAEINS